MWKVGLELRIAHHLFFGTNVEGLVTAPRYKEREKKILHLSYYNENKAYYIVP